VLCAWLRRPHDDSMAALLQPKRRRHALATSFAIIDARSYSEIANVQVRTGSLCCAVPANHVWCGEYCSAVKIYPYKPP
jgi:hypothetical protein